MRQLFRKAARLLDTLKLRAGWAASRNTTIRTAAGPSVVYKEVNGEVLILRVHGRDIDPESPRGRRLIAAQQAELTRAEKDLAEAARELEEVFKDV